MEKKGKSRLIDELVEQFGYHPLHCWKVIHKAKREDAGGIDVGSCRTTFSSTTGTPHYRIHDRISEFDHWVRMSTKGANKSATSRISSIC